MNDSDTFTDVQSRKPIWVWPLVLGLACLAWAAFVAQVVAGHPLGPNPAPNGVIWVLLVLIGVGLPLFIASLRLTIEVDRRELRLRYRPLLLKRIPLDHIRAADARTYRPILEYAGWGIRWAPGRGWCYTLAGNTGVQLTLHDGRKLLLGTDHAEAVAEAINQRRR